MPRIVLHIDRLVLRGIAHGDAAAISAALRAELRSLLSQGGAGTLTQQGNVPALQAGRVHLPQGADASALGQAVAARIGGVPGPSNGRPGGRP